MGRGGGGGGRSSGGGFGGGRSSGGRSSFGSGRNSGFGGSSFGSGRSGGNIFGGSNSRSGRNNNPFEPSSYTGPRGGSFGGSFLGGYLGSKMGRGGSGGDPQPGGRRSGCGTVIIILLCVFILIVIISVLANNNGGNDITRSTIAREPLKSGIAKETGYYTDELGWIRNKTELETGLKYFYNKTGVLPYIYITDTINGSHNPSEAALESYANQLYDTLFTDEAHLLFVFFEYQPGNYMYWYVGGAQTKTVIDGEAGDILMDYVDKYYYQSSLSEEEFFSMAFSDAADRIMTVTKSAWIPVLIVMGIVVLIFILFIWWRRAKIQKNIEAEHTKEILNQPLETFGDKEAENLTKKYDDIQNE